MSQHLSFDTSGVPIRAWIDGLGIEEAALQQLRNVASLPIVHGAVAAMPDVHWGMGATVGSVIPTQRAIIPAAVGVDIGCGMMAVQTTLSANDLPNDLKRVRARIEKAVPHGRSTGGKDDVGSWQRAPARVSDRWRKLKRGLDPIIDKYPSLKRGHTENHLGTLGTGNHFIELCLDESDAVWVMLHSGSRGPGNRIGQHFIALAQRDMRQHISNLPDKDLAYFSEGSDHFDDYFQAVTWAQRYAKENRELMMEAVLEALRTDKQLPRFKLTKTAVNCHHNYVALEHHEGEDVYLTRKGAVSARKDEMGIIPGSMGARSFIVRGLGNPRSFHSCSHGAGRLMSRGAAKKTFTVEDHERATEGVECRKDYGVLDETPGAYKPIEKVMAAQSDLVEIQHTLKQVVCVKG